MGPVYQLWRGLSWVLGPNTTELKSHSPLVFRLDLEIANRLCSQDLRGLALLYSTGLTTLM